MADQKTTELTELITPALTDVAYIVDDPTGTPIGKKITLDNLMSMQFAQVYTDGGAGTQVPGTSYAKVTQIDSNGLSNGNVAADATNNKIVASAAGIYFVFLQISFAGAGNSTFDFSIYCNNIRQPQISFVRKLGSGVDVGGSSAAGTIDVGTAPMDVEVYVKSDGASDSLAVKQLQLFVARIAAT